MPRTILTDCWTIIQLLVELVDSQPPLVVLSVTRPIPTCTRIQVNRRLVGHITG